MEEDQKVMTSKEYLENHDVGGDDLHAPVETLQNREVGEDDDNGEGDDDSSHEFASPIPVSNTQLSHPAEVTSIIIKERQSSSIDMRLEKLSPEIGREDGIPLEVIHDQPTPFKMDISPIKDSLKQLTENFEHQNSEVVPRIVSGLEEATEHVNRTIDRRPVDEYQVTTEQDVRVVTASVSRLSSNNPHRQSSHLHMSPQERRQYLVGQNDEPAPVFTIINTTKSPRVFQMRTEVSSFDEIIKLKLPRLREMIKPEDDPDLYHMVTALEKKKSIFEQAFIAIKQETEEEMKNPDEPNPKTVSFMERIDMIYVRYMDKIVDYLTRVLPMDLENFFSFFQWSFSLKKTAFTITLAQFIKIYIEYIETTHKSRTADISIANKPDNSMLNDVVDENEDQDGKRFLFTAETFLEQSDMITDKLQRHDHEIRRLFQQANPENPFEIPLGRVKELWGMIGKITNTVIVKSGSEYVKGSRARLADDPECVNQLFEHICLAFFVRQRGTGRLNPKPKLGAANQFKSIIRAGEDEEGAAEWPREFVSMAIRERDQLLAVDEDDVIIRPRIIQFADEAAFKPNPNVFDEQCVSADFLLREIEEFFQTRRSIVLVDLDKIYPKPAFDDEEVAEPTLPEPVIEIEPEQPKKRGYVEDDPNYVPPPSELPAEVQSVIDANMIEVFNIYCRKFASLRGDFSQLNQNLYVLGLQGYTKFCKDFKVPLANNDITLVWKKSSSNHQPHEFEQFKNSITMLGTIVNKTRVDKFKARQKLLRQEQKRRKTMAVTSPAQARLPKAAESGQASVTKHIVVSTKGALEKLTDGQIEGELAKLYRYIGRTSLLSEDQSRIQMYVLLELQFPEKYRPKLPYTDEKELTDNILQSKRLLNPASELTSSNLGGVSSKLSHVSIGGSRLASNPAVKERAPRAIMVRNHGGAAFRRKLTQQRPAAAILTPRSVNAEGATIITTTANQKLNSKRSVGSLHVNKLKQTPKIAENQLMADEPVIITSPKPDELQIPTLSAQNSKQAQSSQLPVSRSSANDQDQHVSIQNHEELVEVAAVSGVLVADESLTVAAADKPRATTDRDEAEEREHKEIEDRQNLAEIYKKIRMEKQNHGTILSFSQAKQLINEERNPPSAPLQKPVQKKAETQPLYKGSLESRSSMGKADHFTKKRPAMLKNIPASTKFERKKPNNRQQNKTQAKPTPSVSDLIPQKSIVSPRNTRKLSQVPPSLTFDDLQKMHYSNLNKALGVKGSAPAADDFRPEDFLDLGSGSENEEHEVLHRFRPPAKQAPRKRSSSKEQTNNFSSYQLTHQKAQADHQPQGNSHESLPTDVDNEYFVTHSQKQNHLIAKTSMPDQRIPASDNPSHRRKNQQIFQSYRQQQHVGGFGNSGSNSHAALQQPAHLSSNAQQDYLMVHRQEQSSQPTKEEQLTTLGELSVLNDNKVLVQQNNNGSRVGVQGGGLVSSKSNAKIGSSRISISNMDSAGNSESARNGAIGGKRSLTKPNAQPLKSGSRIPSVMQRQQVRQGSNYTESQLIEPSGLNPDPSQTPQHKHTKSNQSKVAQHRRSHNQYQAILHTDVQSEVSNRQYNVNNRINGRVGAITSNSSAVSVTDSIQNAVVRAQQVQDRTNLNQQRRMDGLMSQHEKNIQKGLNTANRK